MDLAFTEEQAAFRRRAREWIRAGVAELGPLPADDAEAAAFNRAWEKRLCAAGLAGVAWPKEYGGQGLTLAEHLIVSEELGRAGAPEGLNIVGTELTGPILLKAGNDVQRRRFLPKILAAEEIWCQGFSEPNAGSDLAALRTSARPHGDGWTVSGQKVWTSNARFADWCLLLARTDPDAPKHKGLTIFLVPMTSPGITVRPLAQITGRAEFNEVFFDAVQVPAGNVVGAVNDGWRIGTEVLSIERGTNRLYRQSRFMHELEAAVALAGTEALGDDGMRQRLAAAFADLFVFRCHNLKLVSRVVSKQAIGPETSFLKLFWTQAHQGLSLLGLDLHGAEALAEGPESIGRGQFQELYLQTRAETIHAGTVQIQRNIIAERLLGLPR